MSGSMNPDRGQKMEGERSKLPEVERLRPFAVSIATAKVLLGEKSTAALYNDLGRPDGDPLRLEAVKDGSKTLIVLESIERRQRSLPKAKIAPPPKKSRGAALAIAPFEAASSGPPAKTGAREHAARPGAGAKQ
jgi:hypothetical protein